MNWNYFKKIYEESPNQALRVLNQLQTNLMDKINTKQTTLLEV